MDIAYASCVQGRIAASSLRKPKRLMDVAGGAARAPEASKPDELPAAATAAVPVRPLMCLLFCVLFCHGNEVCACA